MSLIDLSPSINENYPLWPSDPAFNLKKRLELQKGHSVNLSAIDVTLHLGACLVAPLMTDDKGIDVAHVPLEYFMGPCEVIELNPKGSWIQVDELPKNFKHPRVLIKTSSKPFSKTFDENYVAFSSECIDYLHEKKVITLGIQTPGLDSYKDCQNVFAQKKMSAHQMVLLKNLDLHKVSIGCYDLLAAPLKIEGAEASPVRAFLKELKKCC